MPDITMCEGGGCHQKNSCYRYTAFPNEYRQAYFVDPPYKMDGCDYLSPLTTDEELYANRSRHRDKPST